MSRKKTLQAREIKEKNEIESDEVRESVASDTLVTHGSKTEAIEKIVNMLSTLSKEDALNCYDLMVKGIGHEADSTPGYAAKNKASVAMKEAIKEDIHAIFGDQEDLSEDFKNKIETLFEAAVGARLQVEVETLREELERINEEKMEDLVETLISKIDEYVSYVAESWVEKNEVAIDTSLTTEVTEEFIEGLADLCRAHNIRIPEADRDVVEELVGVVEDLKSRLNESYQDNMNAVAALKHYRREEIFGEACDGLTKLEVEKLYALQEDMDFDEDTYAEKLETIKETFIGNDTIKDRKTGLINEEVEAIDEDSLNREMSQRKQVIKNPEMGRFAAAISKNH